MGNKQKEKKENKQAGNEKEEKKQTGRRSGIRSTFVKLSMVPALIIGVILTGIWANSMVRNMTTEISNSLSVAAHSVYNAYSLIATGDYTFENGKLKKGNVILSGDYSVVDEMKRAYNMDITLFYMDERVLTTITDENGQRVVGSKANEDVKKWVLEKGREFFSKDVTIGKVRYYGYYVPMLNKDQSIVGIAFAGKPAKEVSDMVTTTMLKTIVASFAVILITVLMSIVASQKLVYSVYAVMEYLGHVSKSDFSQKMPEKAMQREDEIGEMAKYAAETGKTLLQLITTDPLTKLYNRRACGQYLQRRIEKCNKHEENLITVAIGDIDFFKKVNDTYGHDYGDLVLTTLAEKFRTTIEKHDLGIVARWGGEEFLFVLEQPMDQAKETLKNLMLAIRKIEFDCEGTKFQVTMSMGINGEIVGNDFDTIVKKADGMLYDSKENGRDQLRTVAGEVIKMSEVNLYQDI